jgi:hypothetical protein
MDSTLGRRLAQAARERFTASRARWRAIVESGQVQKTIRTSDDLFDELSDPPLI